MLLVVRGYAGEDHDTYTRIPIICINYVKVCTVYHQLRFCFSLRHPCLWFHSFSLIALGATGAVLLCNFFFTLVYSFCSFSFFFYLCTFWECTLQHSWFQYQSQVQSVLNKQSKLQCVGERTKQSTNNGQLFTGPRRSSSTGNDLLHIRRRF